MKPLTKLIRDLKEIKAHGVTEDDIGTIINLIIDYENQNQMRGLDDFTYRFCSIDVVLESVACKAYKGDFRGCQHILEGLEKADRYKDSSGEYENIEDADVEERLDEIIDQAKNFRRDGN